MHISALRFTNNQQEVEFDDVVDLKTTVQLCEQCDAKLPKPHDGSVVISTDSCVLDGIICGGRGCNNEATFEVVIAVNI